MKIILYLSDRLLSHLSRIVTRPLQRETCLRIMHMTTEEQKKEEKCVTRRNRIFDIPDPVGLQTSLKDWNSN
jgi:hypothetical protein